MKLAFFFAIIIFISFPQTALARKVLPRVGGSITSTAPKVVSTTKGVTTSVKFRSDRGAINATFSNLSIASRVDYTLSYTTRGTTQGASGSIVMPASDPQVRELIFGTCSHGVCRYDSGITNAKFTVSTYLKSGKRIVKNYRLKI